MRQLKSDWEELYDAVGSAQRQMESSLNQWTTLDEAQSQLSMWLRQAEGNYSGELVLHDTLSEKLQQLQQYKVLLGEVQNHGRQVQAVVDKARQLTNATQAHQLEANMDVLKERFAGLQKKAKEAVSRYETLVREHQQYSEAYTDTTEWLTGQGERLTLCGDVSGDRHTLQSRVDRLRVSPST